MADTYTWIAGSGDYALAGNWEDNSSGLTPSPAAPGGMDTARIAASGTISGTGAAAALALSSSTGALAVAARLGAGTLSLDGTVLVQGGGDVTASGITSLGTTTAASVLVGPQGTLAGSAGTTLGAGTVTVLGPDALWSVAGTLDVGSTGAGTVLVASGGTLAVGGDLLLGDYPGAAVSAAAPSNRLAVDGAGTTLIVGGTLVVGGTRMAVVSGYDEEHYYYTYGPATGTLDVTGGAVVQAASLAPGYLGLQLAVDSLSSIEDGTLDTATLGALTVDVGQTLTGLNSLAGNLVDNGVVTAGGTLAGSVTGAGTLVGGGTVTGSVAAGVTIASPGLTVGSGASFASTVTGFSGLSRLSLGNDTASSMTWTGLGSGAGTVTLAGPSGTQAFSLSGSYYGSSQLPLVALPDGGALALAASLPLSGYEAADEQQGILAARAAGFATEVERLSGTGSFAPAAAGAFNVALSTAAAASLPAGYQVGVLDAGGALLSDTNGGALLASLQSGGTLVGAGTGVLLVDQGSATTLNLSGQGAAAFSSGGSATILASGDGASVGGAGSLDAFLQGGGSLDYLGTGTTLLRLNGGISGDTVVGGGGNATVFGVAGDLMFGGSGALVGSSYDVGALGATFVGGTGSLTVYGGGLSGYGPSTGDTVYGGSGATEYVAGPGAGLFVGGSGTSLVYGNIGGDTIFGGSGSGLYVAGINATVVVGAGASTVFAAAGDRVFVEGPAPAAVTAGAGNETLNGSAGPGGSTFHAGSGTDTILGAAGGDTMFVGAGRATMTGGSGADLFGVIAGQAGGTALITDFQPGMDHLLLQGFTASGVSAALAQASVSGGTTTLVLPDGTHVTLAGVSSLTRSSIIS